MLGSSGEAAKWLAMAALKELLLAALMEAVVDGGTSMAARALARNTLSR